MTEQQNRRTLLSQAKEASRAPPRDPSIEQLDKIRTEISDRSRELFLRCLMGCAVAFFLACGVLAALVLLRR
jgi:hypothetical protein